MPMKRWLPLLAVVGLIAGCTSSTTSAYRTTAPPASVSSSPQPSPSPIGTWGPASCGFERWPVKTGTDPMANQVNLAEAIPTTVQRLGQIAAPDPSTLPQDARLAPTETTVYQVHATLVGYKMESDSDYHLILNQTVGGQTYTMIAEIPDPSCVQGYPSLGASPFLAGIEQARTSFDRHFSGTAAAGPGFSATSTPVTVTGVGFFDRPHGQSGMAPNAAELHPVTAIIFGG